MRLRRARQRADPSAIQRVASSRLRTRQRSRLSACAGVHFLLLYLSMHAKAQISPGPLARAHQNLNGPANCTRCHGVSPRSPEFHCLECHREIAAEVQQHRGLHASYAQSGAPGSSCIRCHSDHNGEDFAMIHWQPTATGFEHARTGYILDGSHAAVGCRSCHSARHISQESREALAGKDLDHTWMGLSSRCSTCHEDKHQGRFGSDCARCHSTVKWSQTQVDVNHFDHSRTAFPLTGRHRETECGKCHTPDAHGRPRWSGIAFATCSSCHVDVHRGAFKQGCDSCHSTTNWERSRFETIFDHAKTNYPLTGKHLTVACVECHRGGDFRAAVAHAACSDCHKEYHGGQFLKRADGGRCESCHTVEGFSPSTFTIAAHAKTGYPLRAPHDRVACASCHIPAGEKTLFLVRFALCLDCHKDPHAGQFAGAPWGNHCEQCHTGLTFRGSTMTLALHQKTRFPLSGGHMAVACDECHKPVAGSSVAIFHFEPLRCVSCHDDVHSGQFALRMTHVNSSGKPLGCQACHSTERWQDVSQFDHGTTSFPLLGAHRAVACIDCHRPPSMERTLLHVRYSEAPSACVGCHESPHADQFGERTRQCAQCHQEARWKPSTFDHETTKFSLKGAHQSVACAACHVNRRLVNGTPVLFYKPTPGACEACHGALVPTSRTQTSIYAHPHPYASGATS